MKERPLGHRNAVTAAAAGVVFGSRGCPGSELLLGAHQVVTSKSRQWLIDFPLEPFTKVVGIADVYCTAGV
jgi:hypothetical protein